MSWSLLRLLVSLKMATEVKSSHIIELYGLICQSSAILNVFQ